MEERTSSPYSAPSDVGFDSLLEHGEFLQRMVHGLLGDSHDSEDVVQQTWLAVLTARNEPLRKPRTWLARIAKNRSIDMIRRRRVRVVQEEASELAAPPPGPHDSAESDSIRSTVCEAVDRLSEPYRTSIALRFYEGLPPREIARRMGVPVETARTRIKRALAALRLRLDAEVPGGRRAWVVALLRLTESAPPVAATPRGWRPVAIAAALLAFLGAGRTTLPGEAEAAAARERAESRRVVQLEPDGLRDDRASEDTLREGDWDTWPPEPAVVERSRLGRSRGTGVPTTTWAALRDEAASHAALPAAVGPTARAAEARAGQALARSSTPSFAVAASIDESSPLDVELDERIAPGQAWTVDPSGTGDFPDIETAAASARSGDVLLLAASERGYDALRLAGKGVSVLGRGAEPVLVRGLVLSDMAENESVVLRNLRIAARPGRPSLSVSNVRGAVWIEDCTIEGRDADALSIERSSAVALMRSRLESRGASEEGVTLAALRAVASDLSVFDSELVGAAGEHRSVGTGAGGHGAVVTLGRLFAMGSVFEGGAGAGDAAWLGRGGDGGVGLWAEGEARTLACTFTGGPGGVGSRGRGGDALPRYGLIEDLSDVSPRSYRLQDVDGEVGRALLEVRGAPGDVVLSVVGAAPSKGFLLLHLGTRLVAPPYTIVVEGVVSPDGRLEREVVVPTTLALGGGFERYYVQGFFFVPGGEAYLAGGSSVFVLP